MKIKTRLYCHSCDGYFNVKLDYSLNGNHKVICPKCKHIHFRVIEDGKVTGDRYASSMQVFTYSGTVSSTYWTSAAATVSGTSDPFLFTLWTASST